MKGKVHWYATKQLAIAVLTNPTELFLIKEFARNMKCHSTIIFAAIAVGFGTIAIAKDGESFDPPTAYRTINFVEYGGGPVRRYIAPKLETSDVLYEHADLKIVFTTSLPPSTATKTVVAGLFVLRKAQEGWVISHQKRFEASGSESGAKAEITNTERCAPHITVTLWQGGHEMSYSQSASYLVENGALKLDPPQEKPIGEQDGGGQPATLPESK